MKEYKEEQLRAIRRKNEPKTQAKATATANNPKVQEINVEQGNLFGEYNPQNEMFNAFETKRYFS